MSARRGCNYAGTVRDASVCTEASLFDYEFRTISLSFPAAKLQCLKLCPCLKLAQHLKPSIQSLPLSRLVDRL
jgi:hypothetical protein